MAREIARLHTEFVQEVASLPQVGWLAAAQALLDRYEKRLLDLLPLPEFDALQSLVRYRFDEVRQQLVSASTRPDASSTDVVLARYVPASRVLLASVEFSPGDCGAFLSICELFALLGRRIGADDLTIDLCVQTEAEESERPAFFKVHLLPWMYLEGNPSYWASSRPASEHETRATTFHTDLEEPMRISRGYFGYFAQRALPDNRDDEQVACPPENFCGLDLAKLDLPYVVCNARGCQVRKQDETWSGCRGAEKSTH